MQVVLLHALPFDGSMWDGVRTLLDAAVLAPTLYDLGDSIEEWAAAVLDLTEARPLVVVGNSVGGSCALEIARAAPDRVHTLMLVGAKAGVRPEPALRDEALSLLATGGMDAAWERYWRPLLSASASAAMVAEARRSALAQDPVAVARGVRAFHDRRDLTEVVDGWDGPLVVVSGEHDRTPPVHVTRALAEGPRRAFHLVDGCGHYVPLERPDVVADLIRGLG